MQFLEYEMFKLELFGNTLKAYLFSLAVFFVVLIVLKIFKSVIISHIKKFAKKTKTEIDDIVVNGINAVHWPFYVLLALSISLRFIEAHSFIVDAVKYALLIAVVYYGIRVVEKFIDFGIRTIMSRKTEGSEGDYEIIKLLGFIVKVVLWVGAAVLLAANLGYDVTSLVAGLGIGGIAVALALQNILSDIFSSFSIYFDKPFKVGDFVVLGDYSGTIKKIGIKTTRIEALQGEEIVVSNQELTKAKIQNFGQMKRRRVVSTLGVTYGTSKEKLNKISGIIKEIVDKEKNATFDRTHFKTFNDSSLDFEVVYYIEAPDYNVYMDTQESVNMQIFESFEREKIEFAYPTQTVYVEK